jgi:hypothetical protein
MIQKVVEGNLQFEFDERWRAPLLEWDKHAAYQRGIKEADNCKAVDFIGIYENRLVCLIEVKDYRIHRRTKTEDLQTELVFKVRDTIAGLVGSGRRGEHAELCKPYLETILKPHKLTVVLWIEQPSQSDAASARSQRYLVGTGAMLREDKSLFRWLYARVLYVSQAVRYETVLPGLKVSNLPRKLGELVAEILKTMKDRGISVDPTSHRRIMEHTEITDLEGWLERAATVSTVAELFGGR